MAVYWPRAEFWQFPWMVTFWRTFVAVFMLCVLGTAITAVQLATSPVFRPLDYLGDISYGIYLWHMLAINCLIQVAGIGFPAALFWVLAMTFALSALSWRYVEQPFMSLAREPRGFASPANAGSA
jgi:peptidoglycan/LPS O-acetylase OafA/YrhL